MYETAVICLKRNSGTPTRAGQFHASVVYLDGGEKKGTESFAQRRGESTDEYHERLFSSVSENVENIVTC